MICDRCSLNIVEIETEEGFYLCGSCESIYNNCLNEPNEKRTKEEFLKELEGGIKE